MDKLATYALVAAIGEMTRPNAAQRQRECDRWVSLRNLRDTQPRLEIVDPQPEPTPAPAQTAAPAAEPMRMRTPSLYLGVLARHNQIRQQMAQR